MKHTSLIHFYPPRCTGTLNKQRFTSDDFPRTHTYKQNTTVGDNKVRKSTDLVLDELARVLQIHVLAAWGVVDGGQRQATQGIPPWKKALPVTRVTHHLYHRYHFTLPPSQVSQYLSFVQNLDGATLFRCGIFNVHRSAAQRILPTPTLPIYFCLGMWGRGGGSLPYGLGAEPIM